MYDARGTRYYSRPYRENTQDRCGPPRVSRAPVRSPATPPEVGRLLMDAL